jgi:hypothetical protein
MHRHLIPGWVTISALLVVACRSQDQRPALSDTGGTAGPATATAAPNVVTVHARDYAFDAPEQIPAGMTTFRLVNDGSTFHHMVIVRLDSGKALADVQQALRTPGPPPRWAVFVGGPDAPDPRGEANATVDLPAGNYALLCFVDVPGGVPHFAKGMTRALTVTPSSGPHAAAPVADEVITLRDYRFDLSKEPLSAGRHTFEVRTAATQAHELELIQLAPGRAGKDVLAWISKMQGPPPGHGIGGTAPSAPGVPVYFTADLTPGEYLLICFLPDAKDGKPHFVHGMMQQIKVG